MFLPVGGNNAPELDPCRKMPLLGLRLKVPLVNDTVNHRNVLNLKFEPYFEYFTALAFELKGP